MQTRDEATKTDLKKRLRRIQGQVRGVEKMVESDRDCREILQQLAAIRSAAQQVGQIVAQAYACQRLLEASDGGEDPQAFVDDLISVVSKVS